MVEEKFMEASVFNLKHCTFQVDRINRIHVVTIFSDGYSTHAFREVTPDNIREAESQGYSGPDAVWKSLVEHEYLHSLISELLYDRPSLVLETESGRKFHPSWLRYQEEAIVIGVQYLLNNRNLEEKPAWWSQTWNVIRFEVATSRVLDYPGSTTIFLDSCQSRIADLWSQIEKDSF